LTLAVDSVEPFLYDYPLPFNGAQTRSDDADAEGRKSSAKWFLVDASDRVLGRLAQVATVLRGKHKPQFSRTSAWATT
jgi:hypothetical protein